MLGIAVRPPTRRRRKRRNHLGKGQIQVGERGWLRARQGRLLQRRLNSGWLRLDKGSRLRGELPRCRLGKGGGEFRRRLKMEKSTRLRLGAAVCAGGGSCLNGRRGGLFQCRLNNGRRRQLGAVRPRNRRLLNLVERHRPSSEEADHDVDATRNTALAMPPPPHSPWTDVEQRGNTLLRNAKSAECLVKLRAGHAPVSICPE
jgi:hypothetical protein